eukprot:821350-Pyramimonas_sp.AAC.1
MRSAAGKGLLREHTRSGRWQGKSWSSWPRLAVAPPFLIQVALSLPSGLQHHSNKKYGTAHGRGWAGPRRIGQI